MKSSDRLPGHDRKPAGPSSTSTLVRLQYLLDDLRVLHRAETTRIGGREVDVCSVCRIDPDGIMKDVDLPAATSGRELYPCPTVRVARRHLRMVEVGR